LVDINVRDFSAVFGQMDGGREDDGALVSTPITRVARKDLLSAVRNFGVLHGAVNKKIAPSYPSNRVVCVSRFLSETAPAIWG
jgi:hypothetical protein